MDLVSSLRKGDSSRGGRAEFSWDAVKDDKDRENYLGHSLMAPVGRWQKGKNLTWYADSAGNGQSAEEARLEEIRRIKEAEKDALAEALGFPVDRTQWDPVDQKEVQKAIKESGGGADDKDDGDGKGLGFGRSSGMKELMREDVRAQRKREDDAPRGTEGYRSINEREERRPGREDRDKDTREKDRDHRHRHRSRSAGRDRERDREHRHRRHRSRSRSTRRHRHHDDERDSRRHREKGREEREKGREDGDRRRKSRSRSPRHHRRH